MKGAVGRGFGAGFCGGFFVCVVEFRIKEALDVSVLNPSPAGEARPHVL